MNLPDDPATFRPPTPQERPWAWRLLDAAGAEVGAGALTPPEGVDVRELVDQRFTQQGDAESWLGEVWRELRASGVASVTLLELDREVYGPMGLDA
ncbi:hypothetical protein K8Z61_04525 [Nocardioides sp. TRM66260-LWL]|uniref:hypothetical protein n=1 Tax=Nocardioides sp. TRM66260-LWL TaxID=2874478 RepID=UPI001CC42401|nr:hypothetical protein [Nocardioides sp. TRM66260-LWL]MBZ5733754.1 hypothetical protein [Nocardioides sp. TRM66260-LWL]